MSRTRLRLTDSQGNPPDFTDPALREAMGELIEAVRELRDRPLVNVEEGEAATIIERHTVTERIVEAVLAQVSGWPSAYPLPDAQLRDLARTITSAVSDLASQLPGGPPDVQKVRVLNQPEPPRLVVPETTRVTGRVSVENWPERMAVELPPFEFPAEIKLDEESIDKLADVLSRRPLILGATLPSSGGGGGTVDQGQAGTVKQAWFSRDDYDDGEILDDQTGVGGVLTFTFTAPVQLIWLLHVGAEGSESRADPVGGTPTATKGIRVRHEVPVVRNVLTSQVKVFAPSGAVVSVEGYRRTT